MDIRKQLIRWTTAAVLAFGTHSALADSIPFAENFDAVNTQLGATNFSSTNSWTVLQTNGGGDGGVDTINNNQVGNFFGITCRGGSGGCVDLDGSNQQKTGPLLNSGTFNLLGGHTYQLSAWISGNQRGGLDDAVAMYFTDAVGPGSGGTVLASASTPSLAPNSPFTLYTLLYTPAADIVARVAFWSFTPIAAGIPSDSLGAILDDVSVTDLTAVPLPASAWLLLTGLLALGVISRRRFAVA